MVIAGGAGAVAFAQTFHRPRKEGKDRVTLQLKEVFTSRRDGRDERRRIDQLQRRLEDRNEVIAEPACGGEENLKLKKSAGEI